MEGPIWRGRYGGDDMEGPIWRGRYGGADMLYTCKPPMCTSMVDVSDKVASQRRCFYFLTCTVLLNLASSSHNLPDFL